MKPTKSRIDKWKAKHEAMLKLAGESEAVAEAKEIGKVEDEDEDEDHHHADHSKADDPSAAAASSANNKDHHDDHDSEAEPELPNIDPDSGVMINLDGGQDSKQQSQAAKQPSQQVQQALSV